MKLKALMSLITAGLLLAGVATATPLVPPNKVKWSQGPDMTVEGNDQLSMHRNNGPVVADDFVSDGSTITGFHWWGSYLPDVDVGQIDDPAVDRLVQFEISFHEDCPIGDATCNNGGPYPYSTPSNDPFYYSVILEVEESYYGTTAGGEDVYEYWVSVENVPGPAFLGGTWEEVEGETYWVDFGWAEGQLLEDPNGRPYNTVGDIWGWHESDEQRLDFAVTTAPMGPANPHVGPWSVLQSDMAFEVLKAPEPPIVALLGIGLVVFGVASRRRRG